MNGTTPMYFPNLGNYLAETGITIEPVAMNVLGIPVYWYGIIITTGIVMGLLMAIYMGKKEGFHPDLMIDFLLYDIVFAIIGARFYFVAFRWSDYKDNLWEVFNIRGGGIAIYGAIIASVIVAVIYTRRKRISLWQFADVASYGLLVGQAIGRYGNFVNQEAFGGEAGQHAFFAMQIAKDQAIQHSTSKTIEGFETITRNVVGQDGVAQAIAYVQVHPTFFYESCWNIALLIVLLGYRRFQKAKGEIFFLYVAGYGVGRFWIEGLRTDQLVVAFIGIPASQIVAILSVIIGTIGFVWCRKNQGTKLNFKKM